MNVTLEVREDDLLRLLKEQMNVEGAIDGSSALVETVRTLLAHILRESTTDRHLSNSVGVHTPRRKNVGGWLLDFYCITQTEKHFPGDLAQFQRMLRHEAV